MLGVSTTMNILFFEDSPNLILRAQKQLAPQDQWYATMDASHARALVMQGDVEVIVVRRCHLHDLTHALGFGPGEGTPGGMQIVMLPSFSRMRFLCSYLRSQQSHTSG